MVDGDGQLSEPLEVGALSCDTVDQVKLKILAVFKAKFGFAYNIPLRDVRLGGYRRGPAHTTPLHRVQGVDLCTVHATPLHRAIYTGCRLP